MAALGAFGEALPGEPSAGEKRPLEEEAGEAGITSPTCSRSSEGCPRRTMPGARPTGICGTGGGVAHGSPNALICGMGGVTAYLGCAPAPKGTPYAEEVEADALRRDCSSVPNMGMSESKLKPEKRFIEGRGPPPVGEGGG